MSKYDYQIPTKHQIVATQTINNQIHLLDIDQKLIFINFEFWNNFRFLKIENQEIRIETPEDLASKITANTLTIYIPFRSHKKFVDAIITLQDYDLDVYKKIFRVEEKIVFVSRTFIFFVENDRIFASDLLLESTNHQLFNQKYPSNALKCEFNILNAFYLKTNNVLILIDDKKRFHILQGSVFESFLQSLSDFSLMEEMEKMLVYKYKSHWIKEGENIDQILTIFEVDLKIYIRCADFAELFELTMNHEKKVYRITKFGCFVNQVFRKNVFLSKIYQNLNSTFSKMISFVQFVDLFSGFDFENDEIHSNFLASLFRPGNTTLIIISKKGKIIFLPMFAFLFDESNIIEIGIIESNLENIKNACYRDQKLIFTQGCTLYKMALTKSDFETVKEIAVENSKMKKIEKRFKTVDVNIDLKVSNALRFKLRSSSFSRFTKMSLNGHVKSIHNFRPMYSKSECSEYLERFLVLKLTNKTIEIIDLASDFFLLENHSFEFEFVAALYDDFSNLLLLAYENCNIEIFRFEMESVVKIIEHVNQFAGQQMVLPENDFEIQNMIKDHVKLLQQTRLTPENQGFMRKLLKAYHNTYYELNNLNWFSESDYIKSNRMNTMILYHLKSFFNFINISYNDIFKTYQNSETVIPVFQKVFPDNEPSDFLTRTGYNYIDPRWREMRRTSLDEVQKFVFLNFDIRQYHSYLNNIFKDRFAFLREKLSTIPCHFLTEKTREGLAKILDSKFGIKETKEQVFSTLFSDFLRFQLKGIVQGTNGENGLYFNLIIDGKPTSAFGFFNSYESNEKSEWNKELVSIIYQFLLKKTNVRMSPLLTFVKNNGVKFPFLKLRQAYQGLSNTLTVIEPTIDSKEYISDVIENNFNLHFSLITSFTGFMVSSHGQISQSVLGVMCNEFLDKLILKRNGLVNVFIIVLYFFTDNLYLSAASQYLLNIFTRNSQLYKHKLQASSTIKEELKTIFDFSTKPGNELKEQLTKIDLTFLMTTFVLFREKDWIENDQIVHTVFSFLNFIKLFKKP